MYYEVEGHSIYDHSKYLAILWKDNPKLMHSYEASILNVWNITAPVIIPWLYYVIS